MAAFFRYLPTDYTVGNAGLKLSAQPQWRNNAGKNHNSWSAGVLDNNQQHMCKESTYMSDKHTNTDSKLPDWLHGVYNTVANINVPRPLWFSYMVWCVDNNIKHLRQKFVKPHECDESCEPNQPAEPDKCGVFTCGSSDGNCYCVGSNDTRPNQFGWFRCPSTSKLCHIDTCPTECKNKHSRGYN